MNSDEFIQVPVASITSFTDDSDSKSDDDGAERTTNNNESTDEKAEVKEPQTEQELLFCKFCEFQEIDLQGYVKHVLKPSHIKKVAESYNIRLTKDAAPKIFNCKDCLICCNGDNAWNQHLLGQKHRKIMEKKATELAEQRQLLQQRSKQYGGGGPMKTNYGNMHFKKPYEKVQRTVKHPSNIPSQALGARDFANYAAPLIGLEYVTEVQVIGQSPRYQCSLCDAKFDHNLKFPHLVGAKHRLNVLKIKRPNVLQESREQNQKRSELTAMLLREARKLEQEEGRKQVKTKVEKTPRNATSSSPQTGRGGFTRGTSTTARGARGASSSGNRGMPSQGNRGASSRGNRGATRGKRGTSRGGNQGWSGSSSGSSWASPQTDTYSSTTYDVGTAPYYGYGNYGYNNMPYNASHDSYDSYDEMGGYQQSMPSSMPFRPRSPEPTPPPQINYFSPPSNAPRELILDTSKIEVAHKPEISAGLAGALGDLTKLVQNEDDASVALHVSNALTQALLQYRMVNVQDEESNPNV